MKKKDYKKIWIYIEIINIITYFILIHNKKIINIILLYFYLNLISSLYYLNILLSLNPDIKYYLYYKIGIFPFNYIIYYIYRYQTYSNLLYLSFYPKYLYITLIKNNIEIRKYNNKYSSFNL